MSQNRAGQSTPAMTYDEDLTRAAMENDIANLRGKLGHYLSKCPQFLVMLLFLALHYHSYDFVAEILWVKPELIWAKNPDGHTAMHISCEHGLVRIVTELANINCSLCRVRDNLGRSPLHIAAANGRVEVLRVLIKACPDSLMDFTPSNETALHVAAKNGHAECFRFLMQQCFGQNHSSQLSWRDNEGNSVFDIATSTNQTKILQMLSLDKSLQRYHQQHLPKNTEPLTIEQTILAFMAGVAFAALGNYRNMFPPEPQAETATITIMDIISAAYTLPLGFYYIAFITEVFIVSMITIIRSISAQGSQFTVGFTEIVLFLVVFLFMAFLLMVKLFVPHFFIRITFSLKISSFLFVFLLDVTFFLVLIPAVFMVKKTYDMFRGRKKLFLGEKDKTEESTSTSKRIYNEEQVDKKTTFGESMLDIP